MKVYVLIALEDGSDVRKVVEVFATLEKAVSKKKNFDEVKAIFSHITNFGVELEIEEYEVTQ